MKRNEVVPCCLCKKGIMNGGNIVAYKVTVTQLIVDHRAITRQHGLELVIGNPGIAQVMGLDEDLLKEMPTTTRLLCQNCMMQADVCEVWESEATTMQDLVPA